MIGLVIFLVVALPILGFAVWFLLGEARVRIEAGTIGLLIVGGAATSRTLGPGVHYILPYRRTLIQLYSLREMTYLTDVTAETGPDELSDPPLPLALGDRSAATVYYTIRFQVRKDALKAIHDRFGPDGIKGIVRDRSRQVLIETLGAKSVGYPDVFGDARETLQGRLRESIGAALGEEGFDMSLFTLRAIHLEALDETLQAAVRARAELDVEVASAAVRSLRIQHEAELDASLAEGLDDAVLRYRQIELWREILKRWDGNGPLPAAAAALAAATSPGVPPAQDAPAAPPEPGMS